VFLPSSGQSGNGLGLVGGGDGGCLYGAFSWVGACTVGGGDGACVFRGFTPPGICAVGDGDGGFLFGAFFWPVGRAANFWKYKLQVVDNAMR